MVLLKRVQRSVGTLARIDIFAVLGATFVGLFLDVQKIADYWLYIVFKH